MFHMLDSIHSLDPATAEFLWTASVSTLLVLAGAIALGCCPGPMTKSKKSTKASASW